MNPCPVKDYTVDAIFVALGQWPGVYDKDTIRRRRRGVGILSCVVPSPVPSRHPRVDQNVLIATHIVKVHQRAFQPPKQVHHVIDEKQSLLNVAVILSDCGRKTKPAESVNRLVKKAKVDKPLAIARQEAVAIVRGRHGDHIRIRADRLKVAQTIPDRATALLLWHVDLETGKRTQ